MSQVFDNKKKREENWTAAAGGLKILFGTYSFTADDIKCAMENKLSTFVNDIAFAIIIFGTFSRLNSRFISFLCYSRDFMFEIFKLNKAREGNQNWFIKNLSVCHVEDQSVRTRVFSETSECSI